MARSRAQARREGPGGGRSQQAEEKPSTHAREAVSQWGDAARFGAAAIASGARRAIMLAKLSSGRRGVDRPGLRQRLNPAQTEKGGKAGDLADAAIGKLGAPGKVASKLSLGSRIVDRVLPGGGNGEPVPDAAGDDGMPTGRLPIPIQEAMEVAVPPQVAYAVCTQVEDLPSFIDRVQRVQQVDDGTVELVATVRGVPRRVAIEIVEARPGERIDWRCTGDLEHSGAVTFHELGPRLTHIEVSIDLESPSPAQRLARTVGATERAVRADMRRFKAYAELYEDEESDQEAVDSDLPEDEEPEAGGADEAPEADEESDDADEPVDEETVDEEAEEDLDDEELEPDEELESEEEEVEEGSAAGSRS